MRQIEFSEMQLPNKITSCSKNSSFERCPRAISNDKVYVKHILSKMINIQSIVAKHYLYKRDLNFSNSVSKTLFITNNEKEEIKMLAAIFDKVFITKRSDGTVIDIQVSETSELAYEVFAEMASKNEIDEYINYFFVKRQIISDLSENAFFKIEKTENNIRIIENKYFEYLIRAISSPYVIDNLGIIDVSGFRIDEIEQDKYVQELVTQVKHLYLMVFEIQLPSCSFFKKQLMLSV